MRTRFSPALLRRALLRPEPVVAALLLVAALFFYLTSLEQGRPQPQPVEIAELAPPQLEQREVRLVRYDERGLEAPAFASVGLPEAAGARVEAILAALRDAMDGSEWPEGLPLPKAFVETSGRRTVAVLDFRPDGHLPLTVAGEERLLRSIRETLLANGIDDLRFLLDGEAAGVFLEHLAVPSAL